MRVYLSSSANLFGFELINRGLPAAPPADDDEYPLALPPLPEFTNRGRPGTPPPAPTPVLTLCGTFGASAVACRLGNRDAEFTSGPAGFHGILVRSFFPSSSSTGSSAGFSSSSPAFSVHPENFSPAASFSCARVVSAASAPRLNWPTTRPPVLTCADFASSSSIQPSSDWAAGFEVVCAAGAGSAAAVAGKSVEPCAAEEAGTAGGAVRLAPFFFFRSRFAKKLFKSDMAPDRDASLARSEASPRCLCSVKQVHQQVRQAGQDAGEGRRDHIRVADVCVITFAVNYVLAFVISRFEGPNTRKTKQLGCNCPIKVNLI